MKPQGIRILVVDSDGGSVSHNAGILEGKGYQVVGFTSAQDALDEASKRTVHVVLASLQLPGELDGPALIGRLKEYDRRVAVIVTTDQPSLESAVEAMRLGACDYLPKPIEADQLLASVERALASLGMRLTTAETINKAIGKRLRQVRRDQELTTQQLADRVGVTQSQISQIETGRSAASVVTLYNIAQALGSNLATVLKDI